MQLYWRSTGNHQTMTNFPLKKKYRTLTISESKLFVLLHKFRLRTFLIHKTIQLNSSDRNSLPDKLTNLGEIAFV